MVHPYEIIFLETERPRPIRKKVVTKAWFLGLRLCFLAVLKAAESETDSSLLTGSAGILPAIKFSAGEKPVRQICGAGFWPAHLWSSHKRSLRPRESFNPKTISRNLPSVLGMKRS
jgi:hypothetical protein